MNNITKNRFLSTVIILLLIGNIVTLTFFWLKKEHRPNLPPRQVIGGPFNFIVKELAMDSAQIAAYTLLRDEHQKSMDSLREATRVAKDALFDLLQQPNVSDTILQHALNEVGEKEMLFDKKVFLHFQKVRLLCKSDDQQKKFDSIIKEAMRMGGAGQQRREGPPPNDRDGRRPPPPPFKEGDEHLPPPPNEPPH